MTLVATPAQTVGPFFHIGCNKLAISDLVGAKFSGARITLEGHILDGDRNPVPDAMIEIWQANALGKYAHPAGTPAESRDPEFKGYGRVATDQKGRFRFHTIKPGAVPGPGGKIQAPHLAVSMFTRGLLKRLVSRMYFPGEPMNENDPVLNSVDSARRETLVARPNGSTDILHWDIVLQGDHETVFFDI